MWERGCPEYWTTVVEADDGVRLHVEVQDRPGTEVTFLFCHGAMLNLGSWRYQRAAFGAQGRLVLWDHRGHGRSGWGAPPHATVDQLGRDLHAVIDVAAGSKPVVLVGHSMGGMAILGLAEAHPELFGERIVGVALIATSAGGLGEVSLGLPDPAVRAVHRLVLAGLATFEKRSYLVDALRRSTNDMPFRIVQRYLFSPAERAALAASNVDQNSFVPIGVVAEFFAELDIFDKRAVLPTVGRVPTTVLVGAQDSLTPVLHSKILGQGIPGAELVVVPEAGHLLILERAEEINTALRKLLDRIRG